MRLRGRQLRGHRPRRRRHPRDRRGDARSQRGRRCCARGGRPPPRLMADGVTTRRDQVGLRPDAAEHEARMLRVARRLGREHAGRACATTYLGAHALPPEFAGRADDYIEAVCAWLPELHAPGPGRCGRRVLRAHRLLRRRRRSACSRAARALGLPVKLHAEQLSNQHGAALAARHRRAVVRPPRAPRRRRRARDGGGRHGRRAAAGRLSTSCARPRLPPVAALRAAGVPIAIATDHNPGTSPMLSPLLMLNMACVLFRPDALGGPARRHRPGRARPGPGRDRGALAAGMRADFAVWDAAHPRDLAYAIGHQPLPRAWCSAARTAR